MKTFSRLWKGQAERPPLPADLPIRGLALDSRKVRPGDLFLGLRGEQDDGGRYLAEARHAGAIGGLVDCEGAPSNAPDFPTAVVPDLRQRVSRLAAELFDHPGEALHIIGITGTNGKTTSAWLTAALLNRLGEQAGICGTIGYGLLDALQATSLTTPDAIEMQDILARMKSLDCSHLCMEVSSHGLEQRRVEAVPFDCAVLTNVGHDHLDYHGNTEDYWQAKRRLFTWPSLSAAILNADDPKTPELLQLCGAIHSICFGFSDKADVHLTALQPFAGGFNARLTAGDHSLPVCLNLMGQHNLANLLVAVSVALLLDHSLDAIVEVIGDLPSVPGRMQPISDNAEDPQIFVDYAHNPDGLKAALEAVKTHTIGKVHCVFGCGGDRDRAKRQQMGQIASALADAIYLTNDNPRSENPEKILDDIWQGCSDKAKTQIIADRTQAVTKAVQSAAPEDTVLIAGRGHEQIQIIGDERLALHDPDLALAALMMRAH